MASSTVSMLLAGLVVGMATAATARDQAAAPLPRASAGMTPVGKARPILAWTEFCKSYAAECAVDTNEPARITLTPAIWSLVGSVNRRVNDRIQARTDQEHWGVPDRWDLAEDGVGDCEDYQLLKRRLLAEAGLPRRAMRTTIVIDEKGEGHLVLTLITDRGDFALDNKTNAVMAWHETGYTYIKRESQDAVEWVSLGGVTSPVVTANSDSATVVVKQASLKAGTDWPDAKQPSRHPVEPASRAANASPVPIGSVKITSMASLGRELAAIPSELAALGKSAREGNGAAIYELAAREADGRGMPRDLAVAAKLYEKLADAGHAPSQFKLGSFYEKGSGVVRDLAKARLWYERAADRGNLRAMHNLAVLHAENPSANGKPDFASASYWFRQGAEHGVRDSQYNLAVLYARGLGVGQDLIQAHVWFSVAAAQGDAEAGKKRDDVAGKLSKQDLEAAKAVGTHYKPKASDPSANDLPGRKVG